MVNAFETPTVDVIERQATIDWLKSHGFPALPVAPKQDRHKYPKLDENGNIVYEKDRVTPKPRFTGKNPSYLDANGKPDLITHRNYHNVLPSQKELDEWFANPLNGIGTLGGYNDTVWIDFDVKRFASQDECDRAVVEWLEKYPQLKVTLIERTHSGGYRIAVRCKVKPGYTNFALEQGGSHRGEALGEGRFTVLAPTNGESGNPYVNIRRVIPIEVESLESIGIYPTKKANEIRFDRPKLSLIVDNVNGLDLKDLGNDPSKAVLKGEDIKNDRSDSLTTALNEWFGYENWCASKGLPVKGSADGLAFTAGERLGLDEDRIDRILKTINPDECSPAASQYGDDGCWRRVRTLNKQLFNEKCPNEVKERLNQDLTPLEAAQRGLPLPLALDKRGYKLPTPIDTARYINVVNQGTIALEPNEKRLFQFVESRGCWQPLEEYQKAKMVAEVIRNAQAMDGKPVDAYGIAYSGYVYHVAKDLMIDAVPTPPPLPKNLVPFEGCWFDFKTKERIQPTKAYFVTNPLPVMPLPGDYSFVEDWLLDAVEGDQGIYDLIRCLFYLVLTGDTSRQVFFEFIGLGGSGKSTLATFLEDMVGEANSITGDLRTLSESKFETAKLYGKRLITFPDQPAYAGSGSTFKAITGNDSIRFERKSDPNMFDFKVAGVCAVFANEPIRFSDESDAIDRRRISIKFDKKITQEQKDAHPDFNGELRAYLPQWIDHILNLDRDWIYRTLSRRNEITKDVRLTRMVENDPFPQWLSEQVVVLAGAATPIGNKQTPSSLYQSYHSFCEENGYKPIANNQFTKKIVNLLVQTLGWEKTLIYHKRDDKGAAFYGLKLKQFAQSGLNPINQEYWESESLSRKGNQNGEVPLSIEF